ncbi:MAG: 50S ribosomal protein L32 [Chloroflexi bacterium]|nr:50S ribosomal protein L32 [Chloroflexota bacterium]
MAPLPKKKTPRSKRGTRRSQLHIKAPALTECQHCHAPRMPHHVCPECGYYKGREAVLVGKPDLPSEEE